MRLLSSNIKNRNNSGYEFILKLYDGFFFTFILCTNSLALGLSVLPKLLCLPVMVLFQVHAHYTKQP